MTTSKQGAGRALALVLAGAALSSCMAHGQGKKLDPAVYVNYVPYNETFYRKLMSGRVNLYESPGKFRNVVSGQIFASDGTLVRCSARRRGDNKLHWVSGTSNRWSIVIQRSGARVEWDYGGGLKEYASKFYYPETGHFTTEFLNKGVWTALRPGQIQDTWPRALADACPGLKLPAGIRINEKQTSLRMDELRRQDPDAPVRNFPGSQLTAPGRTGLGASRGAPTTTREEVWSWLRGQRGNVLEWRSGRGYVFVVGDSGVSHEVWALADDGSVAELGTLREEGGWVIVEVPGRAVLRYPVGYPVPVLPSGRRFAAWQLTDELIARGEPVPLPWMGQRYTDHRFLFHDKTLTIVAPGDNYLTGEWAWTKGRLEVRVEGDEGNAGSIGWADLARELGVTPRMWTRSAPNGR